MSESNSNDGLDHPILKLTPQEKTAYVHLFNLADTDNIGVVTGERAVSFFEKTSVPAPVLGEIWQIADTENRGLLTRPGFCMVLRLIGWYQNGQQQPSTELAFKPAPLPKFDGITLPAGAQQQPASPTAGAFPPNALQPQLSGQSTGGGPVRIPAPDPAKVQQYSGLFERSGAQNGLLDGGTAKSIFERAGLPNETLGKIWMLSDRQQRGGLDQTEFIVAMHLLTSMKMRSMTALPNTVPQGLWEAAERRGQRPPSRQMSGSGGVPGGVARQFTGGSVGAQPRTQSPLAKPPGYSTPPPQSAQPTGAHWLVTQQEKSHYDQFFSTIDTAGNGVLSGEQAVRFFSDSRLPEDTLAQIWDLADINSEGQLNRDEFAVAMYLIRQQRSPNPAPLPAFLPAALVPPSMRGMQQQRQQQQLQPQQMPQAAAPPAPQSASDDLFGLDSSPTQSQQQQPTLQPQGTGASVTRDPFGGSQPSSPGSPARFQSQQTGFKPFVPTSAFGASLAQQNTGASTTSSQGQARGFPQPQQGPKAPMPSTMDDLLGDSDAHAEESSKITNESTELANMSNQIGNLRSQMEATQTKKGATQAELNATSAQKRDLEQRLQQFRTQYETEVRTVKEMEQQLAASRESTKKLNQEVAMLEGTHQDLQTQHNSISQQLQADQQENANLKQRIGQINAEVSKLKPEIEKMKLDARQQKGLVSINKKQLSTNEAERDRLQSQKADLEREAAEQSRSAAASPETPAVTSQASNVVSPAASTMSSTNPFFRKASGEINTVTTPPPAAATSSSGPTPSAFDALFGPSAAFAPTGQAGSRTGTPPATSFIGRSMPTAATAGAGAAAATADSMSSVGDATPPASPPLSDSVRDISASAEAPPPPPESRQFTPTSLPLASEEAKADSDAASSTRVIPPESRAGGVETPREPMSSPPPLSAAGPFDPPAAAEREIIPGAFPKEEAQPSTIAEEVPPSTDPSTEVPTPAAAKLNDDFDSAFAGFGEGERAKEADSSEDPFAPSSSQLPGTSQARGFDSEFPPIHNVEPDDESSDDDDEHERGGFDDNFMTSSPPRQNGVPTSIGGLAPPVPAVASGDEMASARPQFTSIESTASDLPQIGKETSPPSYEQSDSAAHGGSGERSESNKFPPEFGDLLPSREDPTSPPPPDAAPTTEIAPRESTDVPAERPLPQRVSSLDPSSAASSGARQSVTTPTTDVFVDASSRPMSSGTDASPEYQVQPTVQATEAPRSAFDEFDEFDDLSEAKEADKSNSDFDFGFGSRQSADEFNPAFDSPAQSHTPTPNARSVQPSQESNGFANFTPNVNTSSTSPFDASGGGSIQHTPQNVQHDWDAIFSGLDGSKNIDTSFGGSNDPWGPPPGPPPPATTNGNSSTSANLTASTKAQLPELGRAITPGTEHDDPILKRLTGMGYARGEALNALEMYDYDINKAVDHLAGS